MRSGSSARSGSRPPSFRTTVIDARAMSSARSTSCGPPHRLLDRRPDPPCACGRARAAPWPPGCAGTDASMRSAVRSALPHRAHDAPGWPPRGSRRQQDEVGARPHRPHRRFARPGRTHARHVHRVGDHQAAEAQLAAQQLGRHRLRQRGRRAARIERRHGDVAQHHRVDTRLDRAPERQQLDRVQPRRARRHRRRAAGGCPPPCRRGPGSVWPCVSSPPLLRAASRRRRPGAPRSSGSSPYERMLMTGLAGLLFTSATGANAQCMPSARPSRAVTSPVKRAASSEPRRPDRHRVGQRHDAAPDAEGQAALHVRGHEQRHRRQVLQLVQQRGSALHLGLEDARRSPRPASGPRAASAAQSSAAPGCGTGRTRARRPSARPSPRASAARASRAPTRTTGGGVRVGRGGHRPGRRPACRSRPGPPGQGAGAGTHRAGRSPR